MGPLLSMVDPFVAVNVTLLARAVPDWPVVPLGVAAVPAAADASSTIWVNCAVTPPSTIRLAEPPSASPPVVFSLASALPPSPIAKTPAEPSEMVDADRSEERRVGEEGVRSGNTWGSPVH